MTRIQSSDTQPAESEVLSASDRGSSSGYPLVPAQGPDTSALEDRITQHVLLDLQRQVDLMLEYRLRESLTPVLTRVADNLVREVRAELASTLRELVARAVAQELARHRAP